MAVAFSPDGKTVAHRERRQDGAALGRRHRQAHRPAHGAPETRSWPWPSAPTARPSLTGSQDRTARLWDAATGKPIGPPLTHQGAVTCRGLQPRRQDRRSPGAATGRRGSGTPPPASPSARPLHAPGRGLCRGLQPRRQDRRSPGAATGRRGSGTPPPASPSARPLHAPGRRSRAVAFSPDGKTVAHRERRQDGAALGRRHRQAHRPATGAPGRGLRPWPSAPTARPSLTGSEDGTARLWDAATGKPIGPPLHAPGRGRCRGLQPRRQDRRSPGATTGRRGSGTPPPASPSARP